MRAAAAALALVVAALVPSESSASAATTAHHGRSYVCTVFRWTGSGFAHPEFIAFRCVHKGRAVGLHR